MESNLDFKLLNEIPPNIKLRPFLEPDSFRGGENPDSMLEYALSFGYDFVSYIP
jgi:hypothetical protein